MNPYLDITKYNFKDMILLTLKGKSTSRFK